MKTRFAAIASAFILLGISLPGPAYSQTTSPTSVSPDKQWRYVGGETRELINTTTNQAVPDFSIDSNVSTDLPAVWAPDSRSLAIPRGGGKGCATIVYQLRDGSWETGDALGDGDAISQRIANIVDAKAKKKGMPKGTSLHENYATVEPQKWTDSSTLVVYASLMETAHRNNGEYADCGYGADLLFTLRFDQRGGWRIIKEHRLSEKESKEIHPD